MTQRSQERIGAFDPEAYWDSRLQRFDLSSVGFQGLGAGYNRWLYRLRHVVFRRSVAGLYASWAGRRVLDVGSGSGFYISEWLSLRATVTGSDLTRTSVERLRATFPEQHFDQFDVGGRAPFAEGSFDAISAMDVLFHVVDDSSYRSAFATAASLLKDGGFFIFSENLVHGDEVRSRHHVCRPLCVVETLLNGAGFDVVSRRPMFVLMNAPVDSSSATLRAYWHALEGVVGRWPALGGPVAGLLYPLERLLVSIRHESPTTELMICRKRPR